jgi:hypothetical protein
LHQTPPSIPIKDAEILHGLPQGISEFGKASNNPSNLTRKMTHNNQIALIIPSPILIEVMDILHGLVKGMPEFEQGDNSPRNLAGHMTHDNQIA